MTEYIIAAASTADLPHTFYEAHSVPCIRYTYAIGMDVYEDDCREDSRQKAYEQMRQGVVYSTSMINAATYYQFFHKLMETGKNVIFLDMSKEMSSSHNAADEAADEIRKEFTDQTRYLMDTRSISGGLGILVSEMVRRHEEGMSFEDVIAWGESHKLKIMHRFTVDDLHYLKRGGRVSNASAMVGSMLAIKPVLYVPDDGKLTVGSKVRGRKAALNAIMDGITRDMIEPEGQVVHINHADCMDDALWLKAQILEKYPTIGGVEISNLGVIIGSHCGPGLLTVFYFGDQRKA